MRMRQLKPPWETGCFDSATTWRCTATQRGPLPVTAAWALAASESGAASASAATTLGTPRASAARAAQSSLPSTSRAEARETLMGKAASAVVVASTSGPICRSSTEATAVLH